MARSVSQGIVAGLLICLVLAAPAAAAVTCGYVARSVVGCVSYISSGGVGVPSVPCCSGIRSLNAVAATTADRQATCRCLKKLSSGMGSSLNPAVISGLPRKCGVKVANAISPNTDCAKVR